MKNINVGLVGCGAIGRTLAKGILNGKAGNTKIIMLCDVDAKRLESLHNDIGNKEIKKTTDTSEVIRNPNIDLIIEAASKEVVKEIALSSIDNGKSLMLMSVGAMADKDLYKKIIEKADEKDVKVYLPSGAICGLDGVKSASVENISSAEIISTKNPKSLVGAPYLVEKNIDLSSIKEKKIVFQGNAVDAINGFPKNVNVAVALSLVGIGVDNTRVTIIADPNMSRTRHEIKIEGDFGELHTIVMNNLHPENPKTSYLAALSAIKTLKKISEPIQIGT